MALKASEKIGAGRRKNSFWDRHWLPSISSVRIWSRGAPAGDRLFVAAGPVWCRSSRTEV
jgi:hypothetical protein